MYLENSNFAYFYFICALLQRKIERKKNMSIKKCNNQKKEIKYFPIFFFQFFE